MTEEAANVFNREERRVLHLYAMGILSKAEIREIITDGQKEKP